MSTMYREVDDVSDKTIKKKLQFMQNKGDNIFGFANILGESMRQKGGANNNHFHICRNKLVHQLEDIGLRPWNLSLPEKQRLTVEIVHPYLYLYDTSLIEWRIRQAFQTMSKYWTRKVIALVDATAMLEDKPFNILLEIAKNYKGIETWPGIHPIAGFLNKNNFLTFQELAKNDNVKVLSLLPEIDGKEGCEDYIKHITLGIETALNNPHIREVQIHAGQYNIPEELGPEIIVDTIIERFRGAKLPRIKLAHCISVMCWTEKKFYEWAEKMISHYIGVIVCPSAGISMLQIPRPTLTHNSLFDVFKFLEIVAEYKPDIDYNLVTIGSDNNQDQYVPTKTLNMHTEGVFAITALREYDEEVWAKLICNIPLSIDDYKSIKNIMEERREIVKNFVA